ncbi:hypothetical protein J8M21_00950 [Pseudoalteromonas luteoviolacea]|uniref:hypothetical protein n=1 Tax=Pseudoalteromonas luteoviolacea TaxID=43657 RepID=UPI001B37743E|nr:hypothetical protein [Pseudoalteromonas luteoviolacea]MBQ4875768.1 hypothetical protein [Pseudoalteromonas luteoviolacea]MBQ4904803.1 hypothetical protein [Pseudoalteromonas luteoviolacea]
MGQSGTHSEEVTQVQEEIKRIASKVGISQKELSDRIYREENEIDDVDEMNKFYEKFKKHLQRNTTCIQRLKRYVEILERIESVRKANKAPNGYVAIGVISKNLAKRLSNL